MDAECTGILVNLDCTEEVVQEAVKKNVSYVSPPTDIPANKATKYCKRNR
jgi:putative NIF3 family GTP cyclohydrolase 1 type 2